MFDIGWGKLIIIAVIALVVIGPKELPGVLRMVGQWMAKIRRMAAEFQGQFQEAMREAEMGDLKKHFDSIHEATSNLGSGFDPLETTRKEIESALGDKPGAPAPSALAPREAPAAEKSQGAPGEPGVPGVDVAAPVPQPPPALAETGRAGAAAPLPAGDAGPPA